MAKDTENAGGDEPIELTDREKAICRGEDPDSREAGTADDSADDAASENSDSGADEGGGVDESGDGKQDAVAGGKDAATPSSWIDDTVRLAARPYGMTDDDLGGFSSADEFRRAAAFLDKQSKRAAEAGDKPVDTVTDAAAGAASPSLDVQQYIDAGWDDATVNLVKYAKGLRDELDQLKPIAGQLKETQDSLQRQQLHSFHDILDRMDDGLLIIDFDDMAMAPPVQDIWLLLPDRVDKSSLEINLFIEGYERFRQFNRKSLKCIEPLRAMRMIYFLAWCSRQTMDFVFKRNFPDWGSDQFWQKEINDLREQLGFVLETLQGDEIIDYYE